MILTLLLSVPHTYSSYSVDCISVGGASITDCSAHNGYHLVSCGINSTETSDINGVEMINDKCYAKNPITGLSVNSVSRCCKLVNNEKNIAFTFTLDITAILGNKSDICDDCTSTAQCDKYSKLVGCNMYANGANGGMDGGWIGNIDTSNVLNGGIQLSSVDHDNNKCVANNGWKGQGQFAQAMCLKRNAFFDITCERVLGNSSDTDSIVSCINDDEYLFGCNGIGLWENIDSWYIEKRGDKDVCIAENLDPFNRAPVFAMGLCCRSNQIKKMVDHMCEDEDDDDDDDDEDEDEDEDEIDGNDYCSRYNWPYECGNSWFDTECISVNDEFEQYLRNNTQIWKNETREEIGNNSNITEILQGLIEVNQKAEYMLKELKNILSTTQTGIGIDQKYFERNEYLLNVLVDNHRILYSQALNLWNINHKIVTSLDYWKSEDIIKWIMDLEDGRYLKYYSDLSLNVLKRNVTGNYLSKIDKYDLERWGILQFKDQCDLIDAIKKLIDDNKAVTVQTAIVTWNQRKNNEFIPTNIHTFGDGELNHFCKVKEIFKQQIESEVDDDEQADSIFKRTYNRNRFGVLGSKYELTFISWGWDRYDTCSSVDRL